MLQMLLIISILLAFAPCVGDAQTTLQRTVLGSSAITAGGRNGGIRGTLGQTIIGKSTATHDLSKGFWYRVPKATASIVVPRGEGDIGTTVTVPIVLAASRNLLATGSRDIVVTLRYNRTVLVSKGAFPIRFDGDDAVMTIATSVKDTLGIIAEVPFVVALGNADKTTLRIESVEWPASPFIKTSRTDGEFSVLGVCREGDTVRLIKRGTGTGIVSISPMPIATTATITFSAGRQGWYKIIVVDALGKEHATLADAYYTVGRHTVEFPSSMVPSGQYHLVLLSESETHSRAMVIEK